jgi:hypothetical protein
LIPRSEFILPQPKHVRPSLTDDPAGNPRNFQRDYIVCMVFHPHHPEHHPSRPRLDFLNGNTSPRRRLSEPANTRLTRNWNTLQKAQSRKQPNLDRRKSLDPRQIRAQG